MSTNGTFLAAVESLLHRMKQVHESDQYKAVWTLAHCHYGPYDGPNYIAEIEAVEKEVVAAKVRIEAIQKTLGE